ncbi:MAG: alpha/beta fold hydrolase, partial [Nitrospiraceae bacterium]
MLARQFLPARMAVFLILTACAASSEIPPWFDGLQRQPVHTVTVNGTRIAYLDIGGGPPVILVHGFGGSLWQWEYQQAALATHSRVITLDLPGSGFSDKPDLAYTPDEMIAFFRGFMDALGIQKTALVGNSMGGGLVIGMAVTHPERVDRVVLISGMPQGVREKLT